jgi:hypothetical protein
MHSATPELEWDGLLVLVIDQVTTAAAVATMINVNDAIPKRFLVITLATLGPLSELHVASVSILLQALENVWRSSTRTLRGLQTYSERIFPGVPN